MMKNLETFVTAVCTWGSKNPKLALLAAVVTLMLCAIAAWISGYAAANVAVKVWPLRKLSKDSFEVDIETPFGRRNEQVDFTGYREEGAKDEVVDSYSSDRNKP